MTNHVGSTKHITLPVRDQKDTPYMVQLTVAEPHATGTLSILTHAGEVSQQFALSQIRKGRDGMQLSCYVSGATALLSLKRDNNAPELHVSASIFWPIFEAVYHLDPTEQERFMEWIKALSIGNLASS